MEQDKMRIETVIVTPEMAAAWLKLNTNNRNLRRGHVAKIKNDILQNKWIVTGDPIRFSKQRLIDGQHRLTAIVESGIAVTSVVMWDVEDAAYDYIDQNKTRSAADVLARHGEQNTSTLGAIVTLLRAYEKGGSSLHLQTHDRLSPADMLSKITDDVRDAASFGNRHKIAGVIPQSLVGTCYFLCNKIHKSLSEAFWKCVTTGKTSIFFQTDNAILLRDRLLVHAATSKKLSVEHKFTWCVRAWNAERGGVQLKANGLKFVSGDPIPRFE